MDTNPQCPRCSVDLTVDRVTEPLADFEARFCPKCKGRLLSRSQLSMVEETVEPKILELRQIPSATEQNVLLYCPSCPGVLMEKYRHHRDRKVVLDRCPDCLGIWLDHGELTAIRQESLPIFLANTAKYFWQILH